MSKDRARRRAEREAAAAALAARDARRARWRALAGVDRIRRLRRPTATQPARPGRPTSSALAQGRARENGLLLAVLVPLNAVYWLVEPSWAWRFGALLVTGIAWPLLVVVVFDRRSSR